MLTSPVVMPDKQSKEYFIARLTKTNMADVAKLHSEVYGSINRNDYFQKKYDTAYLGIKNIGFIAYNKEKQPIAYYGVIPCFIKVKDQIILAGQAVDGMTHPQYRCKGMFMELCDMTSHICKGMGIQLLFGFPNQNSAPVMINHLGWIETEKMNRFSLPVNHSWIRDVFGLLKKNGSGELDKLRLNQYGVNNSVINDGYGGVYRSEPYLRYRSFTNTSVVKLGSSDVWIKKGKELFIGDIVLRDEASFFFSELMKFARQTNAHKISFQVSSNCSLYHFFADHYTPVLSFPVIFKDLGSSVQLTEIKFTFADIDIF